jgi:hypothetical protein
MNSREREAIVMRKSLLAAVGAASMLFAAPGAAQEMPLNPREPGQQPTASSQPELTTLVASPGSTAAGEGAANKSRGATADRSVEVDGKTVPLQEQTIYLERTSLHGLYRHGPHHVPK